MNWILPAAILNILWEDIYPRLVPLIWESIHGERVSGQALPFNRPRTEAYLGPKPIDHLLELHGPVPAGKSSGGLILLQCIEALEEWYASTPTPLAPEFEAQLNLIKSYLDNAIPGYPPVPIRFFHTVESNAMAPQPHRQIGWGYDFILSEHGLDIAVPPDPFALPLHHDVVERPPGSNIFSLSGDDLQRRDVYHKYAFRRVSIPPIIIPRGQGRFPRHGSLIDAFADPLEKTVYWRAAVSTGSNYSAGLPPKLIFSPEQRSVHTGAPLDDAVILTSPGTIDNFKCISNASWLMTSSIYAKVLNAHPRIIADIWRHWNETVYTNWVNAIPETAMERLNLAQVRYNRAVPNNAHPAARGNPITLHDARGLYEDYIEVWLPPAPNGAGQGMAFQPEKNLVEFLIYKGGFALPELNQPPGVPDLMDAWILGHAAMPIFTDSGKCHCFTGC